MHLYQLILIVISGILIYSIFDNEIVLKKPLKISKSENKKVQFSLNKKNLFEISQKDKDVESDSINDDIVKNNISYNDENKLNNNKKLIQNDNYGDKIIDTNSLYNINKNKKIINPQEKLVKRLEENNIKNQYENNNSNNLKEDIFTNQTGYWNNLNIGNFTDRDFLNNQVNDFNLVKNKGIEVNVEISKFYDDLTNGKTNILKNSNYDTDIKKSIIDGYSRDCINLSVNNIEN